MGSRLRFVATADDDGKRLDAVCRRLLPALGLGAIHKAIRKGDIRLSGRKAPADHRLRTGDELDIYEPLVRAGRGAPPRPKTAHKRPRRLMNEDLGNLLVRRTEHVVVFNKPRGVLVHGPDGLDTLVRALVPNQSLSYRPGPLHRLDQNTSGLIVFGISVQGARVFGGLLRSGQIDKSYVAILRGKLEVPVHCDAPLLKDAERGLVSVDPAGRPSRTEFHPLLFRNGCTLTLCRPRTGRTHQIRVHAREIGHPLAGDGKYGGGQFPGGFVLHAWRLGFPSQARAVLGDPPLVADLPPPSLDAILRHFGLTAAELYRRLDQGATA